LIVAGFDRRKTGTTLAFDPSAEDGMTELLAIFAPVSLVGAAIVAWTQLRR
jgi:hypothetical protein